MKKDIFSLGNDSYKVILNLTNYGYWLDYTIHDFVDYNFTYYNLSQAVNNTKGITSPYNGRMLLWNVSVPQGTSQLITYNINGTLPIYHLENNYMCSLG